MKAHLQSRRPLQHHGERRGFIDTQRRVAADVSESRPQIPTHLSQVRDQ